MSIKDKLIKLKEELLFSIQYGYDDEFKATFEDHSVGDQNIYRLYYVDFHRIGNEIYVNNHDNIGMINWRCKPFMLPDGMTREEGFKVLSYLTDYIEKRKDIKPCSLKSVTTLDGILDLERFGFTRVEEKDENKILNLFTVTGRLLLFKKSELYLKYFEWYTEGISKKEVKEIYNKYNMEFQDIKWIDEPKEENNARVLKK